MDPLIPGFFPPVNRSAVGSIHGYRGITEMEGLPISYMQIFNCSEGSVPRLNSQVV